MKRWCGQGDVFEDETGDYVTYADYKMAMLANDTMFTSLQRQLVETQRQLAAREQEIADLIHSHDLDKYRSAK